MLATASNAPAGDGGEEALDGVDPGRRGGREVEDPARVISQPLPHLRMLVGAIVVENGVDHLAGRDRALDGVKKADELLVGVPWHAAADQVPSRVLRAANRVVVPLRL